MNQRRRNFVRQIRGAPQNSRLLSLQKPPSAAGINSLSSQEPTGIVIDPRRCKITKLLVAGVIFNCECREEVPGTIMFHTSGLIVLMCGICNRVFTKKKGEKK